MSHDVIPPGSQGADEELLEPLLLEDEDTRSLESGQAAAVAEDPPMRPLEGEEPPSSDAAPPPDVEEPSVEGGEDLPQDEVSRSPESAATRHYVEVAERFGCRPGLGRLIVHHARKFGVPISLAFALIDHESDFRKVFGHDPTIFSGAGEVTKAKYLDYRAQRRASGNRKMQGVGEGQLTWWETQDRADRHGGCWTADANVKVALMTLAANIKRHGYPVGVARYNGSGADADRYSREVRAEARVWHDRLD
jgi:hypothetical protein